MLYLRVFFIVTNLFVFKKINYAYGLRAVRIDEEEYRRSGPRSVKIIEDYSSGNY